MPAKLTTEQFIEKAKILHGETYDYSKVEYQSAIKPVIIICQVHGEFEQRPNYHLSNTGCEKCGRIRTSIANSGKGNKAVAKRAQTMMERYGVSAPMKSESIVKKSQETNKRNHGGVHYSQQQSVREIYSKRASTQQFNMSEELYEKVNNPEFLLELNKTMGFLEMANHIGVTHRTIYTAFQRLNLTPVYNRKESYQEKQLAEILTNLNINFITSDRKILSGKELDFVLPDHNLAIEFNGLYWHSEAANRFKGYHCEKHEKCLEMGYKLIQIWEDDWENNQDRCVNFIKNQIGMNHQKYSARQGKVREISQNEYFNFLESHHMQGGQQTVNVRLGLYIKDVLVAVMGFRNAYKNVTKYGAGIGYELVRFASVGVRGAFGKLESYFIKSYDKIDYIYSFADLEIVNPKSNIYTKMGYQEFDRLQSDYKYWGKITNNIRCHKFGFRKENFKNMGFDIEGKTETQLAKEAGLYKVWDSGKVCYIKRF